MGLENKVYSNPNISKGIRAGLIPLVLTAFVLAFGSIVGCKENPGPISVENIITPSRIPNYSYADWKVKVTNQGGDVTLESATGYEEVMNGYFEGESATIDIPVEGTVVPAHSTVTIASASFMGGNTTGENVRIENTVTVNSDGGSDSDTTTYTVLSAYSSDSSSNSRGNREGLVGAVRGLSDYTKY